LKKPPTHIVNPESPAMRPWVNRTAKLSGRRLIILRRFELRCSSFHLCTSETKDVVNAKESVKAGGRRNIYLKRRRPMVLEPIESGLNIRDSPRHHNQRKVSASLSFRRSKLSYCMAFLHKVNRVHGTFCTKTRRAPRVHPISTVSASNGQFASIASIPSHTSI
jgi:hypothetical protein